MKHLWLITIALLTAICTPAFAASPVINSLTPNTGAVGSSIVIAGSNFGSNQSKATVTFNGTTATITSFSSTSITATVPSGATTGNVIVKINGTSSNGVSFTVTPAPSISSLTPNTGAVGSSIVIAGSNFGSSQGNGNVTFNSGKTATISSWAATSITAVVPSGATTGNVVVTAAGGVASSGVTFTVTPAPNISSLGPPASGAVGSSVNINGSNFGPSQGNGGVTFNGTSATVTSWSSTLVKATVPTGATTGNVVLTAAGGIASNGVTFTIAPIISSLSTSSGEPGASITITGNYFTSTTGTVTFNGQSATVSSWSNMSIGVTVPNGASSGNVVVTAGSLQSNGVSFTVLAPTISSLSPSRGAVGISVTISGSNFGGNAGTVTFNGQTATTSSWSDSSITTVVPGGATTGNVVVNNGGLQSNGVTFTLAPTITGLTPANGVVGTPVTISGLGFGASAGTVTFNGQTATVSSWSNTSIGTSVPSGATPGPVVVTNSSGVQSLGFTFGMYAYERAITIPHTNFPNTDLTNFPLMISGSYSFLATVANGGRVQNPNGYDIIFTADAAGASQLNHEIETYNPTTGAINFWVRIPTLSHTTDTTIYVFYGNANISASQENKTGVWDTNFQGVWHLNGSPLSAADSTSQGHNGTINGATATTGLIGGAGNFTGASQDIQIGNMGTRPTKGTISMWVQAPALASNPNAFTTGFSCNTAAIRFELNSAGDLSALTGDSACHTTGTNFTTSFTVNQWHYLTVTWDSSVGANSFTSYYDGANPQTITDTYWPTNFDNVTIGLGYGGGHYWNGQIDEVRISDDVRSPEWIAAEYSNQKSPSAFYSVGAENAVGVAVTPANSLLYPGQTQQFTAAVSGTGNTAVTWSISPTGVGSINTAGLYSAPNTVSTQQTVTVTATSTADNTKSASATVTLSPPISVSVSPANITLISSQTAQFTATLTNTSNSAVTWSISPSGTGSVSASGAYTAPATITAQQTVTLTATSVADASYSGSTTITLVPASSVFSSHRPITIDHTKVPNTDQVNFPVLISGVYSYLATVANAGEVQSASGYDIIFTSDAAGSTKLDHEMETYDPTTGTIRFWVRIPTLSHTTDTVIYMQYGNSAITSSLENKTGVWNSNYRGVWHLANGTTLNPADSTANQNNGTNNGATPTSGEIDGAAAFNGSNQSIAIGPLGTFSDATGLTLSAWVNPSSTSGVQKIVAIQGAMVQVPSGAEPTFIANLNATNGQFIAEAGKATQGFDDAVAPTGFTTGQWSYVAGTFDGSKVTLYVNGVKQAATSYFNADFQTVSNSNGWTIGEYITQGVAQQWWNGSIDEVRVSSTVLSPDWIRAEFNNQNSPSTFYSLGAENTVSVAVSPTAGSLYANQTQQFIAMATNAVNPAVTWSITPSGSGSINTSGLYTAPSSISSQQTLTVTATSNQDSTKSASATITLYPPATVTVSPSNPTAYAGQTLQFTATVSNAPSQAVTWSISPAVGTISSSGLYTTPAAISSSQTVTVTATSAADPAQSGTATVTLGQWSQILSFRRAITISHTQVANSDQSNFPIVISGTYSYLATVANGGEVQSANGYDIIFTTDAAGTSKLDHEIDSYNPTTGTVVFWVRIPTLSHTADTVIYMLYGSSAITTSQENKAGVWSNSYAGVWHFGSSSLSTSDSTANANNATNHGVVGATGKFGEAGSFDGTGNTYFDIPSSNSYKPTSALTLEAWVNVTAVSSDAAILSLDYYANGNWTSPWKSYSLIFNQGTLDPRMEIAVSGTQTIAVSANAVSTGQWAHVAATYDGSNMIIYVNGASAVTKPLTGNIDYGTSKDLAIGTRSPYSPGEAINGLVDEARVSTVVRSANWIATEYNNQNSPSTFYTFGVENAPLIRSLSPSSAEPGSSITIQGASFGTTTGTVSFNGTSATVSSWADTSITAVVPNGSNSGPIVVTNSGGVQSNGFAFTVLAPFISTLNPNRGPAGTSVTISGTGFGANAGTVTFNGVTATITSWSDTSIVATVPSGAGMGNVIVTNNGEHSNPVMFGAPFVSGLNPTAGPTGTSVTISGVSFGSVTGSVTFEGVSASITSWSDTSIVATVPTGALSGPVVVTVQSVSSNPVGFLVQEQVVNGTVNYSYDVLGRLVGVVAASGDAAKYTYDAVGNILSIARTPATQPTILSFSPNSGPVGTQVTISGSNFSANPASDTVTFNGTSATISSASTTQLVVAVPSGASSGAIVVTAPAGTATSSNSFTVTSSSSKPSITSFSPQIAAVGASVTISGSGFDTIATNDRLIVNTTAAAAPTSVTGSSMVLTVPSAGSGHISLSTLFGAATSSGDLFIPPSGYSAAQVIYTGRAALGSTTTVSIPTTGIGLLLFDAASGKNVNVSSSSSTFSNCTFELLRPDSTVLGSSSNCATASSLGAQVLPLTGTYAVLVAPGSGVTGSVGITLTDLTSAFATITSGGNGVTLSTTTPGQAAQVVFSASGGQQATLQFSSNTFGSITVNLLNPDGTTLSSTNTSASSFSLPTVILPQPGIYTVTITPSSTATGSIQVSLTLAGGDTPLPSRPAGTSLDNSNPLSTNLAGLFVMNEASGTTDKDLVDSQLANFAGTAPPTWWTSDPSIFFQGGASLNSYLDAGTDLNFDQLTPGKMTIVAKVFITSANGGGIAEKNDGDDVDSGFAFGIDSTGALRLTVEKSNANMQVGSPAGNILSDQWMQLAFTWDGTVGTAASAHLYLNGVEQSKTLSVDGSGTIGYSNATNQSFRIGNVDFDFPGSLNGRIAYLAVYKGRILSTTEMGQLDAQLPIH